MPSQKKKSYVSQDKECIRALTPGEREAHERYSFLRGKMTLQDCQMASEKALPFPVQLSTLTMAATTDLSIFVQNSNSFINTLNHLRSRQNCTESSKTQHRHTTATYVKACGDPWWFLCTYSSGCLPFSATDFQT